MQEQVYTIKLVRTKTIPLGTYCLLYHSFLHDLNFYWDLQFGSNVSLAITVWTRYEGKRKVLLKAGLPLESAAASSVTSKIIIR